MYGQHNAVSSVAETLPLVFSRTHLSNMFNTCDAEIVLSSTFMACFQVKQKAKVVSYICFWQTKMKRKKCHTCTHTHACLYKWHVCLLLFRGWLFNRKLDVCELTKHLSIMLEKNAWYSFLGIVWGICSNHALLCCKLLMLRRCE